MAQLVDARRLERRSLGYEGSNPSLTTFYKLGVGNQKMEIHFRVKLPVSKTIFAGGPVLIQAS